MKTTLEDELSRAFQKQIDRVVEEQKAQVDNLRFLIIGRCKRLCKNYLRDYLKVNLTMCTCKNKLHKLFPFFFFHSCLENVATKDRIQSKVLQRNEILLRILSNICLQQQCGIFGLLIRTKVESVVGNMKQLIVTKMLCKISQSIKINPEDLVQ